MKKTFTFLLVAFSAFFSQVFAQLPFSDGFETGDLSNWTTTGNAVVTTYPFYEGSYAFQGTDSYELTKNFGPIDPYALRIAFAMRASQTNTNAVEFHVKDGVGNLLLTVFFQFNGWISAYDGVNAVQLIEYQSDNWYHMELEINQFTHKYNLKIDNNLVAEGFDFQNSNAQKANIVQFRSTSVQSIGFVDSFVIEVDSEKSAMIALFDSLEGESWTSNTNWASEQPFNTWHGVVTNMDGHVTGIYMNENNIGGAIPVEIGDLTFLEELDLSNNSITGPMPASFGQLTNLSKLYLNHNQLSGGILPEFGSLTYLSTLDLGSNNLTGTIPAEIGNLSSLTELLLWSNQLSGEIPQALGNCSNLERMGLSVNTFTGQIPDFFSGLTSLSEIIIGWNQFTGEIPSSITSLSNLTKLELAGNQLTGTIPSDIGSLSNLNELFLQQNKLEGAVPATIQNLTSLTALDLSENNFTVLPLEFNVLSPTTFNISNNFFTFEDLQNASPACTYDPQKTIHANDTTYLTTNVTGQVKLDFDNDVVGSSYAWYLGGVYQSTTSGNSILATLTPADTYYMTVEVTNPDFANFTLQVDSVVVIVQDAESQTQTFDGYTSGEYLTVVNNDWVTFNNMPGSSEDALISDLHAQSTPNSVKIDSMSNVFYSFGNQTTGRHRINFLAFIPTGKNGYFLLQHNDTHGQELAVQINLLDGAQGQLANGVDIVDFTFWHDGWNNMEVIVDLDNDWATFSNNGNEIHSWRWSNLTNGSQGLNQLGCINFFTNQLAGNNEMFLDDFLVEQLNPVNCSNIGLVGTFNNWGNDGSDHAMTRDDNNSYHWFTDFSNSGTNEIKFRSNNEWAYNWGSNTFPTGTGIQDGPNIPITTGDYTVHFYCNSGDYNFESQSEKNALEAFYNATNGDNWTNNTNWLSNEPLSNWFGVVTNEEGKVIALNLEENNLNGILPEQIGDLVNMDFLRFSGNALQGEIPVAIGMLTSLNELLLENNNLTGQIPVEIGLLTELNVLKLSNNSLTGSIPTEIGNCTGLLTLELYMNQLTGEIPASIGNLSVLEEVNLNTNQLTGSLPAELFNLTALQEVIVTQNNLSGTIPAAIGNLTQMEYLMLSNNQFSGSLPTQLGNLNQLNVLWLQNNNFEGEMIPEIAAIPGLLSLNFDHNTFSSIDSSYFYLSLDSLNAHMNNFTFEDVSHLPVNAQYAPQNTYIIDDTIHLAVDETRDFELPFDQSVSTNFYTWYRDGELFNENASSLISITEEPTGETHYYYAVVTNPNFDQLTLYTDSLVVETENCLLSMTVATQDALCYGTENGLITITAMEGTEPYEYSISDGEGYQTSNTFNVGAGTYMVMVKDAIGCQTVAEEYVINQPETLTFTTTITNVLCFGGTDGSIEFAASGGTYPYQYSIDDGTTWQTTTLFSGLTAGTYQVATKDANGCVTNDVVTITQPTAALTFTTTITNVLCFGGTDGSIEFAASGGTYPYQYSIDNGTTWQTTTLFSGLTAGTYQVATKDANGCVTNDVATITQPTAALTFTTTITNVLCFGGTDGSIEFAASGGTYPYQYSIDDGTTWQTTTLFSGLTAGTYQVATKDANGCVTNDVATITQPTAALTFTTTITNVLCSGETNGVIEFNASGGTLPYEYSIDEGTTWQTDTIFNGLAAGEYFVSVRDANLCTSNDVVTITDPETPLSFTTTITNVLCSGEDNGVIEFNASGGTLPYEYSIDDETTWQTDTIFNGLAAGEYFVSVRDANLCTSNDVVTITDPETPLSFTTTITNVLCSGEANGVIEFNASGGTLPYEYSIDDGTTWQTDTIFNGLAAGEYFVSVRDANLCTSNDVVTITQPTAALTFTTTITNVLCFGGTDGSIEFAASGGTYPYQYSIDNGTTWQTTTLFSGLAAGTYQVATKDANGCITNDVATITQPTAALTFTTTITNVSCYGEATGSIQFNVSGGTAPYEYSTDNGISWVTTSLVTGLVAANYQLSVRDANLCQSSDNATINQPANALDFTANITDVTCFGGSDGVIEIIATGGTPAYLYSIDGGVNYEVSPIFNNLVANSYDVMVIDNNSCETLIPQTVNQPASLPVVSFTGLDAEYCANAVAVILTGNQAPDGTFTGPGITDNGDGTATFDPVLAGVGGPYDIVYSYTDPDGCSNSSTQQTTVNALTVINFSGLSANYCIDGAAVIITGSEAPDGSFTGPGITDNGDGTAEFDPQSAGVGGPYSIVYEFVNLSGCTSQNTQTTQVNALPEVSFETLEPAYCLGDAVVTLVGNQAPNGTFTGTAITDNGDGTADFDPNAAGLGGPYSITYSYTDGFGCSNSDTQQTSVFDVPIVSFTGLSPNYCEGDAEILITGSEAPNGTFSGNGVFDQGNGTAYFYPVVAGVGGPYNITYSFENANGCVGTDVQQTTVNVLPVVSFTGLSDAYCVTEAAVTLTGNLAPNGVFSGAGITDNGNGTASFDPATAGAGGPYNITYSYTSPEGCSDDEVQQVTIYPNDAASFTGLDANYCSTESAVVLIGNLAPNGTFSGQGITDLGDGTANFDPQAAGVGGPYAILYSYTNAFGCYAEQSQSTEVFESPVATFSGLEAAYCIDHTAVSLTGNYSGGTFTGQGITDLGNGTALFNPATAGAGGPYDIQYEYTTPEGCSDNEIQSTDVVDFVALSFTQLDAEYCASDDPITLTGNMAPGGSFSGPGVFDNGDGTAIFSPELAGAGGPYTITYEYVSGGLCLNTTTQSVTIFPFIAVSFTGLDASYCNVDSNVLLTGSEAPNGYFLGQGVTNNGDGTANFNPASVGVGGPYQISYYVENGGGCNSVSRQMTSVMGDPEASFDFTLGGCNEDAVFIDQSTSANGAIVAWNWNFDDPESDGSNTSTVQNPLHLFVSNQSTFNIELSVEDEMGCVGSVIQPVEPFSSTQISGTVISSEGDTIRSGYVLAFLYSNGMISTQVDSVQIMTDGSFTCNGLATCVEYIFHGYANEENYPDLIPRWHYDAFYWFDATPVTVNWDDQVVEGVDISVFELIPPPQGNSSLSGGVFYFDSKGEPVKNVDVVLEYDAPDDKGDEIVGYDPTNELGAWEFDALGEGAFKIRVDIPGLSMDSIYTVTITAPDTHITGLNYYLDPETGIYIDFTGLDELENLSFGSIGVMPNPSNGQFYLEILKAEHRVDLDIQAIELWDMDGRLVKDLGIDFRGQHLITHVNLSDVESGMYFIKVKNRGEVGIAKIVIQH